MSLYVEYLTGNALTHAFTGHEQGFIMQGKMCFATVAVAHGGHRRRVDF